MDTNEITVAVRERYAAFAAAGGQPGGCCAATTLAAGYATELGLYPPEELARVPAGARALSRGCGNPTGLARLEPGDTVVDFGCGGGIDVILAARKVAPGGQVIGVDGVPEMIVRARSHVTEAGVAEWVSFAVAELADTGLRSGCADVVLSNCVINLCPDKAAVYREAYRVLRPGGRLAISDVVFTEELPTTLAASLRATWSGCVGGTLAKPAYFDTLRGAGFVDLVHVGEHRFTPAELGEMARCPGPGFTPAPADADLAAVRGKVASIKFTAAKPWSAEHPDPGSGGA